MFLNEVAHYPGYHCASTGIRNAVNYHGFSWSEAMCFGLGAGLGIYYLRLPGISPSRMIHVRTEDLESCFFNRIGFPFQWKTYNSPEESEEDLLRIIETGVPALVQTDIYYLSYFNSNTHFPGHVITVWGYDKDKRVFLVTDTEREELLAVPFAEMRRARFSSYGFFDSRGNLFAPQRLSLPEDMPGIIGEAIMENSRILLDESLDFQGVKALENWENELPEWGGLDDWQWIARFTYQVIEKRGTGGGGFRFLYSDFLKEAADYLPEVSSRRLPSLMFDVARAWQDLAADLKNASEQKQFDHRRIRDRLSRLRDLETSYHREALNII